MTTFIQKEEEIEKLMADNKILMMESGQGNQAYGCCLCRDWVSSDISFHSHNEEHMGKLYDVIIKHFTDCERAFFLKRCHTPIKKKGGRRKMKSKSRKKRKSKKTLRKSKKTRHQLRK